MPVCLAQPGSVWRRVQQPGEAPPPQHCALSQGDCCAEAQPQQHILDVRGVLSPSELGSGLLPDASYIPSPTPYVCLPC